MNVIDSPAPTAGMSCRRFLRYAEKFFCLTFQSGQLRNGYIDDGHRTIQCLFRMGVFMQEKKCSRCKQVKPLEEFCKNRSTKDGYYSYCRTCNKKIYKSLKMQRFNYSNTLSTKVCRKCHIEKPVSEFNKNIRTADGYHSYCKSCMKFVAKKSRSKKPLYVTWNCNKSRISATYEEFKALYDSDPFCYYCRTALTEETASPDHKVPISHNADSEELKSIDNIVFSCVDCNRLKHTRTDTEFLQFLQEYRDRLNRLQL